MPLLEMTLTPHAHTQSFEAWMPWDANPLYALLHESIYCQGRASRWAAHRVRNSDFSDVFDAALAVANGAPVLFTGARFICRSVPL